MKSKNIDKLDMIMTGVNGQASFTSLDVNAKAQNSYKINKLLTIIIALFAAFFVLFFLVFGSLTNNRFGTHLVWNGDLIHSPFWFVVIIFAIVGIFLLWVFLIFIANLSNKNSNQGKTIYTQKLDQSIRITSFSLVGASLWFLALSAFSFAAFNWQFFDSQMNDEFTYNTIFASKEIDVPMQALIIGVSLIIVLTIILLFGFKNSLSRKEASNRKYYTKRNVSVALIASGWFLFNLSTIAFGTFGGDLYVLLKGLGEFVPPFIKEKEGIYGVNNAISSYSFFIMMFVVLFLLIIYWFFSYLKYEENKKSITFNVSVYVTVLVVALFAFIVITPYFPGSYEYNTFLPGPIAPWGETGGIYSAYVYFDPDYFGTTSWLVMFYILWSLFIIPLVYEMIVFLLKLK